MNYENCTDPAHQALNVLQHQAVHAKDGRYLLAACAGSGKTRVVIQRIGQLLQEEVPPGSVGAFTFAKDAAQEMSNRSATLGFPRELRFGTLHSLCLEILRAHGAPWVGAPEPRVDERNAVYYEMKRLMSAHYKEQNLDPGVASTLISLAKAQCLPVHPILEGQCKPDVLQLFKARADRSYLASVYLELYERTEQFRFSKGLVDYDDMLLLAWLTLNGSDEARNYWSLRFQYLMVDEAQDSSRVQNAVTDILASGYGNIMLIGDIQQSIYMWRGAVPREFVDYASKYTLLSLPINYRSTVEICQAATKLTAGCEWNVTGETVPHPGAVSDPNSVQAFVYDNPEAEAASIVEDIKNRLQAGSQPRDLAVLYRVTWLAYPIEEALMQAGIPYVVWSGMNFFERREVKDLIGYLRVAALQDHDESNVKRVLNAPFRYISKAYIQEVEDFARSNGIAFLDALKQYYSPKAAYATKQARAVYDILLQVNSLIVKNTNPADVLAFVIKTTNYMSGIKRDEGEEGVNPEAGRGAFVHQLMRVASKHSTVESFLKYVDTIAATLNSARKDKSANAVVLSSIHKAKGLEWDYVYGIGWADGILPHAKNLEQDEELRLAYVCLTRARKRFTASYPKMVVTPAGNKEGVASPYLLKAGMTITPVVSTSKMVNVE